MFKFEMPLFPHTKKDLTQETLPIFQEYREILLDQLSNYDEELLEKLIEEEPISPIFLREKLLQLVLSRQIMPILCGTAKNNINIFSLMDKINQILPNPIHGGSSDIQNILKSPIFKNYSIAQVFKINHDGPTFNVPISYFRVYKGNIKSSNLSLKIGMRREDNALSGGDANDAEAGQAGAVNPASGSSGFEIHQNDITFSPLKGSNLKLFKPFGNEHKSVIKIDLGEIGIIRNQPDLNSGDFIIQQNQGSAVESGVINKKLNLSQNEEKILYNIFTKSQIQEPLRTGS